MMKLIESEIANNKTIVLDGNHFVNCHYTGGTVLFEGGEWADTNTVFEGDIKVTLAGAAFRTMALLARFGSVQPGPMPPAPPTIIH